MVQHQTSTASPTVARVQAASEQAAALEAADWAGAIDLLSDANRAERADALEIELTALRMRSFDRLADSAHQPSPAPPVGALPRLGESRLPELGLAELSARVLRDAMVTSGALLVRAALSPDQVTELRCLIDDSFAAREVATTPGGRGQGASWRPLRVDPELDEGLARKWIRVGGGVLLCDAPRAMFHLLELYTRLGLHDVATDYLGGRPVLSANKCTLRRVGLDAAGGWHQDGAFLGEELRALNLWLALTPCGIDAPGLDIVPTRFDHVLETGTSGSYFDWAVGDAVVQREAGVFGIVRPRFEAGDLLLFDELFLHRTAVEPTMTRERHAIEMWCFASSAYPNGHVPLVW